MTARDRIAVFVVAALAALAGSWMLVIKPQRTKAAAVQTAIIAAQGEADNATSLASQASSARAQYARDYERLVKLGRAVPVDDDVASLVYQIDVSARQAGINFRAVNVTGGSEEPEPTAAATAAQGDKKTPAPAPAQGSPEQQLAGDVTQVPVSMSFEGGFFAMTRFLTSIERFTLGGPGAVAIRGRLVSLDSVAIKPSPRGFPMVRAEVTASAYRAPLEPVGAVGDPAATPAAPGAPAPSSTASPVRATTTPGAAEKVTP